MSTDRLEALEVSPAVRVAVTPAEIASAFSESLETLYRTVGQSESPINSHGGSSAAPTMENVNPQRVLDCLHATSPKADPADEHSIG
jgi:hypothetical protein